MSLHYVCQHSAALACLTRVLSSMSSSIKWMTYQLFLSFDNCIVKYDVNIILTLFVWEVYFHVLCKYYINIVYLTKCIVKYDMNVILTLLVSPCVLINVISLLYLSQSPFQLQYLLDLVLTLLKCKFPITLNKIKFTIVLIIVVGWRSKKVTKHSLKWLFA